MKANLNKYQKTYVAARAAFELTIKAMELAYSANKQYQEATKELKENHKNLSKDKIEELDLVMIEIETVAEKKFKKWELFQILREAEKLLVEQFKNTLFVENKAALKNNPEIITLFTTQYDKIKLNIKFWQKLVDIAMRGKWEPTVSLID